MSDRELCDDCHQEFDADDMVTVERHPLYSLTGEPEYDRLCPECYVGSTMVMSASQMERARRFREAVDETARRMLEGEAAGHPVGIFGAGGAQDGEDRAIAIPSIGIDCEFPRGVIRIDADDNAHDFPDSENREGDGGSNHSGRQTLTGGGSRACAPAKLEP